MSDPTIYFLTPEDAAPRGGVRQIYRAVDVLNAAGVGAAVVHEHSGFRCDWFANETVVVPRADVELSRSDLLVVPEVWAAHIEEMALGVPKVIFSQGPYQTFEFGLDGPGVERMYRHDDVRGVVVVSADSVAFFEYALPGVRVDRIRVGLDPALFHARESKLREIAYMPRRRPQEARDVLGLLHLRGATRGWSLTRIDGVGEAAAAAVLRRSMVFLCLSGREGFGLPAAEAMAAGCVVVGFPGFGGRELFENHGIAVPDGDVVAMARAVEDVLDRLDADPAAVASVVAATSQTVREDYSLERNAADIARVFPAFLDARARGAAASLRLSPLPGPPSRWRSGARLIRKGWRIWRGSAPVA